MSHVRVRIKGKWLFFGKFGMPRFLETPILRFALLPYYSWNHHKTNKITIKNHRKSVFLSKNLKHSCIGSWRNTYHYLVHNLSSWRHLNPAVNHQFPLPYFDIFLICFCYFLMRKNWKNYRVQFHNRLEHHQRTGLSLYHWKFHLEE